MQFLNEHLLSFLIILPIIGAVFVMLVREENEIFIKIISLVISVLILLTSARLFILYYIGKLSGYNFVERIPFLPNFGITYLLGIDGISATMVLLTGILSISVILISWSVKKRVKEYFTLVLLALAGIAGVFVSLDLFFFILFYELASIPMYFLIGIWGSDYESGGRLVTKEDASLKLIIYLQLGGGLIMIGALALFLLSGLNTFDMTLLAGAKIPLNIQLILFPIIFIGFGIEAGFFPFHTWLPNGHSAAPTALSMLLAGLLLKMGGYGMIRVTLDLLPLGAPFWMKIFAVAAVINILYGALCALGQKDIKYIIAYSSISHMGVVVLGIAAFNLFGFFGSVFQMFSHGIITALLFAAAGLIYEKSHTRNINELGGIGIKTPLLAVFFVLGALATLGLPGMSGFVAELLTFIGAFKFYPALTILAVFGLVLTAMYILRAAQKIFFGPLPEKYLNILDLTQIEKLPLIILSLSMIIFGIFPFLITNVLRTDINNIIMKIVK